MKYKLVIFDCDGTLIDTVIDVAHCLNEALIMCGFAPCSLVTISSLVGKPLETIVEGLLSDIVQRTAIVSYSSDDVNRIASTYRRIYTSYEKPHTKPFPGMVELVDTLLAKGVIVAVNSNKPNEALENLVARCFPGRNLRVVGYEFGRPTKPNPAGALEIIKEAGLTAEDSVYVGDTKVDFDTAVNAGMDCIIMTWGQGTEDVYTQPSLAACCKSAVELYASLPF